MNTNIFKTVTTTENSNSARKLSATQFFKDNDPMGYFEKSEFEEYARGMVRNEPEQFMGFIDQLKNGIKLNLKLQTREDKSGRKYTWVEFMYARATSGYKVIVDGEILRFIEDYATGKISVTFTAEELLEAALND